LQTITLDFDNVTIDNIGNDTNDRGIELYIVDDDQLTGRLDNITVSNTGGTGILMQNTTGGLVDPVFSGLNITKPGATRYGLQLIGNSDGFTRPTVDDSFDVGNVTNLIGDATAGSAGTFGMLVQGVNGVYDNITVSNASGSAFYISGTTNPAAWEDASIIINDSPSPWRILSLFPSSIGVLGTADLGYTAGTGSIPNHLEVSGTISNTLLVADPMNTGNSVWHVPTTLTIPAGVTLTIDDGAVLKFGLNTYLYVDGTLITGDPTGGGDGAGVGTKAMFTSIRDNS
ncbi:MAG: hypothetical protein GY746_10180, partial [Gammaproteobacteria bacterium]|nr:hypothetical protein [Gammaproteobacteria bacterium]